MPDRAPVTELRTSAILDELRRDGPPATLLVLGTDASGKDHVANVLEKAYAEAGHEAERRNSRFSGSVSQATTSEDKGALSLLAERIFLRTFPILHRLLPLVVTVYLKLDGVLFRESSRPLIVVSHTALRVLALCLAHRHRTRDELRLPSSLERALVSLRERTQPVTMVLDCEDATRRRRIREREKRGKADHFDRFMARDSERSERTEDFLVWIAVTYLGAVHVLNDDLDDDELLLAFHQAATSVGPSAPIES
ncbi:MAG: hypothetical protein AAF533_24045 [Acidobacteriota bacterium]